MRHVSARMGRSRAPRFPCPLTFEHKGRVQGLQQGAHDGVWDLRGAAGINWAQRPSVDDER